MNVQEYIASGILEAYALGEVTAAERTSVEQALAQYPELREEFRKVEETLEKVALGSAIRPRADVKNRIMEKVAATKSAAKVVALVPEKPVWKLAAAASIAIALLSSILAVYYRQQWKETSVALSEIVAQNQHVAENYNVVNEKLSKIQSDFAILENIAFTKVVMKGTANDKQALASVYWNASSEEVYISIQQLKAISKENQFQLWAIVNGKTIDVGVFDLDFNGLLKMKNVAGAAAFAVTIEPRGGSENPTFNTMQVIGSVIMSPS